MRRSIPLSVLVPFLLAACAGAGVSPVPSAAPWTPGGSSTASPSDTAATQPPLASSVTSRTASPVPCPTASPIAVADYVDADPACFGSDDVTIAGWTDDPVDGWFGPGKIEPTWLGDATNEYSLLRSVLPGPPCTHESEEDEAPAICPGALVGHIDPASSLTLEGNGRWTVVTGHRDDPAAVTCRIARLDDGDGEPAPTSGDVVAACRSRFVLTSAREAAPPPEALTALKCPGGELLELRDYMTAVPGCFGGRTVSVRAWEDQPIVTGWEAPAPKPSWLSLPDSSRFFWSIRPASTTGCGTPECYGMFVYQDPRARVRLGKAGRWVIITGHREDSAAERCRWPAGTGPQDAVASGLVARRECRSAFVIESIRRAEAP